MIFFKSLLLIAMEIPHSKLSPDTLQALIEDFVLREGTDYGEIEIPLEQKTWQIMNQLDHGEIAIVFDPDTESCNIVRRSEVNHVTDGV